MFEVAQSRLRSAAHVAYVNFVVYLHVNVQILSEFEFPWANIAGEWRVPHMLPNLVIIQSLMGGKRLDAIFATISLLTGVSSSVFGENVFQAYPHPAKVALVQRRGVRIFRNVGRLVTTPVSSEG